MVDAMHVSRLVVVLAATFVLGGLSAAGSRGAVPKAPPEFWSPARCERVLPEEHPGIRQLVCVGSGGAAACRWTTGHRARLYSELTVLAWYRQANFSSLGMHGLEPGVVRSFTLATRARRGFARIVHRYGDEYVGWPADFYMAHVRLLGTHIGMARFGAFVATIAAKLTREESTVNCSAP